MSKRILASVFEDAYASLPDKTKSIELADGITVKKFYELVQNNNRQEISSFVCNRFDNRYLMPFKKVKKGFNSGFAQMAICCLMIETLESFRNGWNDTMKDAKRPDGKKKPGGEIFEDFFAHYPDQFSEFIGLGKEFYTNIRCGILHQAESQNGWLIMREGVLYDQSTRIINSTRFRKRMGKCLTHYCAELKDASAESAVWQNFKKKMAYVIQNCVVEEVVDV